MTLLFKDSKNLIMHDFIQHVSRVRHEMRELKCKTWKTLVEMTDYDVK